MGRELTAVEHVQARQVSHALGRTIGNLFVDRAAWMRISARRWRFRRWRSVSSSRQRPNGQPCRHFGAPRRVEYCGWCSRNWRRIHCRRHPTPAAVQHDRSARDERAALLERCRATHRRAVRRELSAMRPPCWHSPASSRQRVHGSTDDRPHRRLTCAPGLTGGSPEQPGDHSRPARWRLGGSTRRQADRAPATTSAG